MRQIDSKTFITSQLLPGDVATLAASSITVIINNRPDGEEPGQPTSANVEAAARAAGLDYRHIPIAGGFSEAQIAAMADALEAEGKILAFCKSGTRSTYIWALALSRRGVPAEELIGKAAAAGYDLTPITAHLQAR